MSTNRYLLRTSGGATLHCSTSGIVDHFALDEEASFAIARDVIASLNIDEDVSEYGKADFIVHIETSSVTVTSPWVEGKVLL